MRNLNLLGVFLVAFLCISCHNKEKNKICDDLSGAIGYLHAISNDSPSQIKNGANFTSLCSMSGSPVNYESAQWMYANGCRNNAICAQSYIDDAIVQAASIGDSELLSSLQTLSSTIHNIETNAISASENAYNYNYDSYINSVREINKSAIDQIEECRKIVNNITSIF